MTPGTNSNFSTETVTSNTQDVFRSINDCLGQQVGQLESQVTQWANNPTETNQDYLTVYGMIKGLQTILQQHVGISSYR